jgi:hypothetical protein
MHGNLPEGCYNTLGKTECGPRPEWQQWEQQCEVINWKDFLLDLMCSEREQRETIAPSFRCVCFKSEQVEELSSCF